MMSTTRSRTSKAASATSGGCSSDSTATSIWRWPGTTRAKALLKKSGNKVPDYKETKNYVKKITVAYGKTHHPVLAPAEAAERFGVAEVLAE